jgi:hypothetical protein
VKFTIKPRPQRDGYYLESEALSHGRLWYGTMDDAIGFAVRTAGSAPARIELCDRGGKIISLINHGPEDRENGSRLGKI